MSMDLTTTRQNHALPKQWAEEMALVSTSSAPTTVSSLDNSSAHTPPETLRSSTTILDKQLDGFLDRCLEQVHHAKLLKGDLVRISPEHPEHLPKKISFKLHMEELRSLFSTQQGEDFIASLEKNNPNLAIGAYGENTIELTQGIDRLEHAVREEENKRNNNEHHLYHHTASFTLPPIHSNNNTPPNSGIPSNSNIGSVSPPGQNGLHQTQISIQQNQNQSQLSNQVMSTSLVSPASGSTVSLMTSTQGDRIAAPPVIPSSTVGHTLSNLTSDETLQVMQSDIQALKLELMRLQRSKVANGTFSQHPTPHSLPNRSTDTPSTNNTPTQPASSSNHNDDSNSTNKNSESPGYSTSTSSNVSPEKDGPLPASILSANNNVNVVRVKGRSATGGAPTYVSHLEQMKSRIEALEKKPLSRRAKSVARLGRTHTMGSMYESSALNSIGSTHRFSSYNIGSSNSDPSNYNNQNNNDHATSIFNANNNLNIMNNNNPSNSPSTISNTNSIVKSPVKTDENANPNLSAMITPPRNIRRSKHRSLSTSSPLATISPNNLQYHQQIRHSPQSRLSSPVTNNNHNNNNIKRLSPSFTQKLSPSMSSRLSPSSMNHHNNNIRRRSPIGRLSPANDMNLASQHRFTIATSSPGSSPSPKRASFTQYSPENHASVRSSIHHSRTNAGGGVGNHHMNNANNVNLNLLSSSNSISNGMGTSGNTSPARLFFDAPEEMLSRPQSHAAARDIQRYSLKVARRFIPVGNNNNIINQNSNVMENENMNDNVKNMTDRMFSDAGATSNVKKLILNDTLVEPRAKSAVTISPSRGNRQVNSNDANIIQKEMSDTAMLMKTTTSPSTIDTTGSGSGAGKVIEEIEGDMWVRKGLVWKRWRRRFASIVTHQFFGRVMCLFSYNSNGGVISTKSQIVVLAGSKVSNMRDTVDIGGEIKYIFSLTTTSKVYYFAAENHGVRSAWMKELKDAAKMDLGRPPLAARGGRSMAFRKKA